MKKTAIVYDKWLSTLGGGEVVACNFARILKDSGYDTLFIAGKLVDPKIIKDKLGIDLSDITFMEIWNDETRLKQISKSADIFLNSTFMDYSYGLSKFNIFYTSFPTETDDNIKGKLITKFILPISSYLLKPRELIEGANTEIRNKKDIYYPLKPLSKIAFYYLHLGKTYHLTFKIHLEYFSKTNLKSILFKIDGTKITSQNISINHFENTISYFIDIKPTSSTIILSVSNKSNYISYLINPEIQTIISPLPFINIIQTKFNSKIRAGLFKNSQNRINKYELIFSNSEYTKKWIKKYWQRDATVLYPPFSLIKLNPSIKKQNYICSVGRFFTLGHGKKQEIMIEAFKKLCDQGTKNWELHLAGGLGTEPTSLEYANQLKTLSKNYPIYFHFNESRQFIENLYLESKIYWHAAGFGENPNKNPIKFEHFGITPIEAISGGCIPVLFNGGGLSEVIKLLNLDPELHLFDTINQLVSSTQKIIDQNIKLPTNIAKQLESLFGLERFKKQFKEMISKKI